MRPIKTGWDGTGKLATPINWIIGSDPFVQLMSAACILRSRMLAIKNEWSSERLTHDCLSECVGFSGMEGVLLCVKLGNLMDRL